MKHALNPKAKITSEISHMSLTLVSRRRLVRGRAVTTSSDFKDQLEALLKRFGPGPLKQGLTVTFDHGILANHNMSATDSE